MYSKIHKPVTKGEKLYEFLLKKTIKNDTWRNLGNDLLWTDRGDGMVEFFQKVVALNAVGRIVITGEKLFEKFGGEKALFESEFGDFLKCFFVAGNKEWNNTLERFSKDAVYAARQTLKSNVVNRYRQAAATGNGSHCFMCGVEMDLRTVDPDIHRKLTVDHIWPRSYGGDSIDENYLAACSSCNSDKKNNFPSWPMCDVQSLILGLNPSENKMKSVTGTMQFALYFRAGHRLAAKRSLTLKESFQQLGPWEELRLHDDSDIGDFFNLYNYNKDKIKYYGEFI